jgi:transposase-like protein
MQEIATISREEIKAVLIEIHRENQMLWCKWLKQTIDFSEKSGLYRYREGFDAAILNLAQRLHITLGSSNIPPKKQEEKATVITLERISILPNSQGVSCLYCHEPLFRKGTKRWYCPSCKVNFRLRQEEG